MCVRAICMSQTIKIYELQIADSTTLIAHEICLLIGELDNLKA